MWQTCVYMHVGMCINNLNFTFFLPGIPGASCLELSLQGDVRNKHSYLKEKPLLPKEGMALYLKIRADAWHCRKSQVQIPGMSSLKDPEKDQTRRAGMLKVLSDIQSRETLEAQLAPPP